MLAGVDCTHVGELLVGQHLVEHHERVLGREQPPQVLVLPPATLFIADFLHCNKRTSLVSALGTVDADSGGGQSYLLATYSSSRAGA